MIIQFSDAILDITLNPTGKDETEIALAVASSTNLRNYGLYNPVYADFGKDLVVVKVRSTDAQEKINGEAIIFYNRGGDNQLIFWGLSPTGYFDDAKVEDITTVSIPVIVASAKGEIVTNTVRFTQKQKTTTSDISSMRLLQAPVVEKGTFKGMVTAEPTLVIGDKEIYSDDANKIQIVFNQNSGAAASTINLISFFNKVDERNGKDDKSTPWWVWVIVGLVVFLVIVGVLLYFLTKNKEDDEEDDEYMTPEDGKKAKKNDD